MSFEQRLESLRMKHETLEAALKAESRRPLPDPVTITNLKRQKLKIKDEIANLTPH
jgi:hypothetical protein